MVDVAPALLIVLSFGAAVIGTLGGLGGAIFLVPALILLGVDPRVAAPLGIITVAAGSLAAGPAHLDDGVVHHRLGVTLETSASAAAILGAAVGGVLARSVMVRLLALVALGGAASGFGRSGLRNQPHPVFSDESPGEWPGTLAGAYVLRPGEVVPYQARRVPLGLVGMFGAGFVAGFAGVGGGFIKTPVMSELMHVPVRVAAATTTFTVGITAAASLIVYWRQDRIDVHSAAAVVVGGLAGGLLGAEVARRIHPRYLRTVLSVALVGISLILMVTA